VQAYAWGSPSQDRMGDKKEGWGVVAKPLNPRDTAGDRQAKRTAKQVQPANKGQALACMKRPERLRQNGSELGLVGMRQPVQFRLFAHGGEGEAPAFHSLPASAMPAMRVSLARRAALQAARGRCGGEVRVNRIRLFQRTGWRRRRAGAA